MDPIVSSLGHPHRLRLKLILLIATAGENPLEEVGLRLSLR